MLNCARLITCLTGANQVIHRQLLEVWCISQILWKFWINISLESFPVQAAWTRQRACQPNCFFPLHIPLIQFPQRIPPLKMVSHRLRSTKLFLHQSPHSLRKQLKENSSLENWRHMQQYAPWLEPCIAVSTSLCLLGKRIWKKNIPTNLNWDFSPLCLPFVCLPLHNHIPVSCCCLFTAPGLHILEQGLSNGSSPLYSSVLPSPCPLLSLYSTVPLLSFPSLLSALAPPPPPRPHLPLFVCQPLCL